MSSVETAPLKTVMSRTAPLGTTPLQKESPFIQPPADLPPYVHQDFPRMVYKMLTMADGTARLGDRLTHTPEELAAATKDGYGDYPDPHGKGKKP